MKISDNKLVSMTYSIYEGEELLENVDTPVSFIYGKKQTFYQLSKKLYMVKKKIVRCL